MWNESVTVFVGSDWDNGNSDLNLIERPQELECLNSDVLFCERPQEFVSLLDKA